MRKKMHAQSMVEVAIFGAIVVSIIAWIVTNVVTSSFAQQHALRTMRMAFTKSQENREKMRVSHPAMRSSIQVSRPYNLVVIEDRLYPGVSKWGASKRLPYVASAQAVFTRDLFMDASSDLSNITPSGEGTFGTYHIPIVHMKIDGTDVPFALGWWRQFEGPCKRPKRNPPDTVEASWTTDSLPMDDSDVEEGFKKHGRVMCMTGQGDIGYPAWVFHKRINASSEDPADMYFMIDPSFPSEQVMNPFDPTQGLLNLTDNTTSTEAGLTVNENNGGSRSWIRQTDEVIRYIKTNGGIMAIDKTIRRNKAFAW